MLITPAENEQRDHVHCFHVGRSTFGLQGKTHVVGLVVEGEMELIPVTCNSYCFIIYSCQCVDSKTCILPNAQQGAHSESVHF